MNTNALNQQGLFFQSLLILDLLRRIDLFFGLMPKYCVMKHSLFKNATETRALLLETVREIMLKGFRKPFHVLFMLKGLFSDFQSAITGIVAANLIAMDVRVYFECVLSRRRKRENFAVFAILKDSSGKKISYLPRTTTDAVYKLCTEVIRKFSLNG